MRILITTTALLAVVTFAVTAAGQDQGDAGEKYRRSVIRLETALMKRLATIMGAAQEGKDERTRLEKAREKLESKIQSERAKSQESLESVSKLAAAILKRHAALAAAKKNGMDIRSATEKAQDALKAESESDPEFAAARKMLLAAVKARELAVKKSQDSGRDIRTEFEKAVAEIDAATVKSDEYKAALKVWHDARPGEPVPDDLLLPMSSAVYKVALLRLKLMRNSR